MDSLIPPKLFPRRGDRPLLNENGGLFFSRGVDLMHLSSSTQELVARAPAPLRQRLGARNWWLSRASRFGFHGLVRSNSDQLYGIIKGGIVRVIPSCAEAELVFSPPRGSRPLGLCIDGSKVFFGEYFRNTERETVRIFGSDGGDHWDVVHEFAPGAVRHVHGLVRDEFRGGIWILTGDSDQEAGLWFTNDHFGTVEEVIRGTQRARAVSIFPFDDGLVVPMDTPQETNHIHYFRLPEARFERLAELAGSALYGVQSAGLYLVGTCVERSKINRAQHATLMGSIDGMKWVRIATAARDFPTLSNAPAYLQYPVLVPVAGPGDAERVFGFGIAVQGWDGFGFSWDAQRLKEALRSYG